MSDTSARYCHVCGVEQIMPVEMSVSARWVCDDFNWSYQGGWYYCQNHLEAMRLDMLETKQKHAAWAAYYQEVICE